MESWSAVGRQSKSDDGTEAGFKLYSLMIVKRLLSTLIFMTILVWCGISSRINLARIRRLLRVQNLILDRSSCI